ncbi:Spo11/DNA topoisomerase VI subunit A [Cristinia sonorae]|uniref:Spo11/DNA topoisomerase VI subunit A n=1 Tax=Cristinia sonorae TaxID=1940300 RepID=A0A8K0XL99_9AGAR|nr:Spo11/DNA topoisomerase VI subunit A [Cristinia sonorae]
MQLSRGGNGHCGQGIIITGKGYPDVATRQLVCTLADNLPASVSIMALVDADPYGIDILSVYKYGSAAMSHEHSTLAAPRIEWIGVFSSELSSLCIDKDDMVPITKHDEKKAVSMLRKRNLPKTWSREIQHMLYTRRKAEIEIIARAAVETHNSGCRSPNDPKRAENSLVAYLMQKIRTITNTVRQS